MLELMREHEENVKQMITLLRVDDPNYPVIEAAINALDNTNALQEFYVRSTKESHVIGERVLRLYGLLQGLFVGIDALYALAYAICGSKTFININQNHALKELKYIRNDVVGHPVRREYSYKNIGSCILPLHLIQENIITYEVRTPINKYHRTVDLLKCIENYYRESNGLLEYMYRFKTSMLKDEHRLLLAINNMRNLFITEKVVNVIEAREVYKQYYFTNKSTQSRVLWRLEVVTTLHFHKADMDLKKEYIQYAILNQMDKLLGIAYELDGSTEIAPEQDGPLPLYLRSYFQFVRNNMKFKDSYIVLKDISHPYWTNTLNEMTLVVTRKNIPVLLEFFQWLKQEKTNGNGALIFGICSCFGNFRKPRKIGENQKNYQKK